MIGLIPWLFILVYGFYENINNSGAKRMLYGVLAIVLIGLVTFSGFYTAYFTMLFMAILFGVLSVCSSWTGEKPVLRIFHFIRNNSFEVFAYILISIAVLLPSVWVYLPILHLRTRPFGLVLVMLPRGSDFFNVSFDNLIWGKLLKLLFPEIRPYFWELETGFPFATLLSFFACVLYFAKRYRAKEFQLDVRLPLVLGVSVFLVMLLILRIGRYSLWIIPYHLIPGTSALRAVSRYNMFLSLPVSLVLAFGADALLMQWKTSGSMKPILISVVSFFFF
jgi:hypothetical protein